MFGKLHLENHIGPLYVFIHKVVLNTTLFICQASLVAQRLKHLLAMQETQVRSLGWEDPLENGMVGYPLQYSCLEYSMDSFCLLNSR